MLTEFSLEHKVCNVGQSGETSSSTNIHENQVQVKTFSSDGQDVIEDDFPLEDDEKFICSHEGCGKYFKTVSFWRVDCD